MAERSKALPVIVVVVSVLALIAAYTVYARWMARQTNVPLEKRTPPPKPPTPLDPKQVEPAVSSSSKAPEDKPQDPGSKILQGADKAFKTGYWETALTFYKDFDLRYAGTETYEAQAPRVWSQMKLCNEKMPKKEETLPQFIEGRRKLHEEWMKLKALVKEKSAADLKNELEAYASALPPKDGRRGIVEAWLAPPPEEKK